MLGQCGCEFEYNFAFLFDLIEILLSSCVFLYLVNKADWPVLFTLFTLFTYGKNIGENIIV